ncbi:MAG: hypothetical protein P1R58_10230 [bacterium]|nr:hypothetical protein [bacterium]
MVTLSGLGLNVIEIGIPALISFGLYGLIPDSSEKYTSRLLTPAATMYRKREQRLDDNTVQYLSFHDLQFVESR